MKVGPKGVGLRQVLLYFPTFGLISSLVNIGLLLCGECTLMFSTTCSSFGDPQNIRKQLIAMINNDCIYNNSCCTK
jgi:hypothetical protein